MWTLVHKVMAGVIAVLVILVGMAWCSALSGREAMGVAKERSRVADSVIKANAPELHRSDTAIVRDTVVLTNLLTRVRRDTVWRRDTVRVGSDTTARVAIPLPRLREIDSTIQACGQLLTDCASFRMTANATMVAQQSKIDALTAQLRVGKRIWDRCGISAGAGAVYSRGTVTAGPGVMASCKVWP